jgi:hypothetical protein
MDILLECFWMVHHDTAPRAKKDAVLLALTLILTNWIATLLVAMALSWEGKKKNDW